MRNLAQGLALGSAMRALHRPIDAILDDVKRMAEVRGGDPWAEPMSAEQQSLFTEFATHPRVLRWCRTPAGRAVLAEDEGT